MNENVRAAYELDDATIWEKPLTTNFVKDRHILVN
jgi:hypothetical protein